MIHNKPILYILVLMLALPLLLSCTTAPPPDTSAADIESIKAASAQFVDNFNSADFEALSAIYTEDAKLIPPNFPMMVGRENILGWFSNAGGTLQLTMIDLQLNGDMANVVGDYTISSQPEEGEGWSETGNYVEQWKRANGAWKIDLDIWNSSAAPPMPEEGMMEEKEMMEE